MISEANSQQTDNTGVYLRVAVNFHNKVPIESTIEKAQQDMLIDLDNYDHTKLKKKLLKKFRLSLRNIDIYTFWLTSESAKEHFDISSSAEDFFFFLNHILHMRANEKLIILIEGDRRVKPKRESKRSNVPQTIKFDENGEVALLPKDQELNRPKDALYKSTEEVSCAFCRFSSNDREAVREVGPFYTLTFQRRQKRKSGSRKTYYMHLMCAIWTPQVYISQQDGRLKNVKAEIKRCNKIVCKYCAQLGGGLGCKVDNCKMSYHYKCAIAADANCALDAQNFVLYCSEHRHQYDEQQQQQEEEEEEDENQHEHSRRSLTENAEDEYRCQECHVIRENEDSQVLICDGCDKGFHLDCLPQKLEAVPENDWYCQVCEPDNKH